MSVWTTLAATQSTLGTVESLANGHAWSQEWFAGLRESVRTVDVELPTSVVIDDELRSLFDGFAHRGEWLGLLQQLVEDVRRHALLHRDAAPDLQRLLRRGIPDEALRLILGFERTILQDRLVPGGLSTRLSQGVGDSHVHSGGAVRVWDAIELFGMVAITEARHCLLIADETEDRTKVLAQQSGMNLLGRDASSRVVNLLPIALGMTLLSGSCTGPNWREVVGTKTSAAFGWILDGTFWGRVALLSQRGSGLTRADLRPMLESLMEIAEGGDPGSQIAIRRMIANAFRDPVSLSNDSELSRLLRGWFTSLCIIHGAMTSPLQSDLVTFAHRFRLQSQLRKADVFKARFGSAPEPPDVELFRHRADDRRVFAALKNLMSDSSLVRLELRKTVTLDRASPLSAMATIRNDVLSHARAISAFLQDNQRRLTVQMPVGLLRESRGELSAESLAAAVGTPHRWPVLNTMAICHGLGLLLERHPETADFLGGLDVAGEESAAPNWLFCVAFQYLERFSKPRGLPSLSYSMHVGEYFESPLQGVRRVGETLLAGVPVSRLGHCLALDKSSWHRHAGTSRRAADALDDLVWASWYLRSRGVELSAGVAGACAFWVRYLSSLVYGAEPSPAVLAQAYLARYSIDALKSVGVSALDGPPSGPPAWRSPVEARLETACSSEEEALLRAYLFEQEFSFRSSMGFQTAVSFDGQVEVPTGTGELSALCEELAKAVHPLLISDLKSGGPGGRIVIECCPTSNLALGGYRSYAEHPIAAFHASGLICTVSTDDPGIFSVSVDDELASIAVANDLSGPEVDRLRRVGLLRTAIGAPASRDAGRYGKIALALESPF